MNNMKYIVLLGDGMADYPVPELGGLTPLQAAIKPNMNMLASKGETGMVKTVPPGIPPGSDPANLSVMGYDPKLYYTGRSPLEAVSMGINLSETDTALRCNLVTLSDGSPYSSRVMLDYSADEITTDEAAEIIREVNEQLATSHLRFYPGISYRHCMVWEDGPLKLGLTPPHDILGKNIAPYLPSDPHGSFLLELMEKSADFLQEHPVNLKRKAKGLNPANSIWLWGEGRKPSIPLFRDKYGLQGSVVSAVDLIKGIGLCAGLRSVEVEGATGNIHTNFLGKAQAALQELKAGSDFVYLHVEAPDECGHRYEIENKVKSIELIDSQILGTLLDGLEEYPAYSILLLPDHPTPLALRTHTSEPVPFALYRKGNGIGSGVSGYDEFQARTTGLSIEAGHTLMDYFIRGTR